MGRQTVGIFIVGILALGVLSGAACGGDDDKAVATATPSPAPAADNEPVSAGAIVPNTFLTYQGNQYRLSDILQASLVSESEFSEVGEASGADVSTDLTVFTKAGDAASVYTFWQGSGLGEAATPDSWYRWEPAD